MSLEATIKPTNVAVKVRSKNFKLLMKEEHQFISIDCILFPNEYKPGFKAFPRFDLQFSKERILELIHLPKALQLAMGFFTSQDELQAHYIVNKYYFKTIERSIPNDDNESESKYDFMLSSVAPTITERDETSYSMKSCGKKLYRAHDCRKEMLKLSESKEDFSDVIAAFENVGMQSFDDPHNKEIHFANFEDFANYEEDIDDREAFIVLDEIIQFRSIQSSHINANETKSFTFVVHGDDYRKKPSSMTTSIAFQGDFIDGEYEAARLSASLNLLGSKGTKTLTTINIGYAPYRSQIVNSEKKLGHILIMYDFESRQQLTPAKYMFQLDIHAQSTCQFSVDTTCIAAYHAKDVIIHNFCEFFSNCRRKRLEEYETTNIKLDQRIAQRKITQLQRLIEEAEKRRRQYEEDVDSKELEVEIDLDMGVNYATKIAEIKQLEMEHANQCRLISVREQIIQDTTLDVQNLEQDETKHLDLVNQLQQQSNISLNLLPKAIDKLFGIELCKKSQNVMSFVSSLKNQMVVNQTPKTIERNSIFPSLSDENGTKEKCRLLLQEIDRISGIKSDCAASAMLHATPQLFPKDILQTNLEMELNKMICEEIFDYEAKHPLFMTHQLNDEHSIDTFDSQEEEITSNVIGNGSSFDNHESFESESIHVKRDYTNEWNDQNLNALIKQRDNLGSYLLQLRKEERKSKQLYGEPSKEMIELEEKIRSSMIAKTRIEETLQLQAVDKELYDAATCTSKYIVIRSLHGYDTLMDRSGAIEALLAQHDHLVAVLVSKEIIDDVLDRMFQGWHFGIPGHCGDRSKLVSDMVITNTTGKAIDGINKDAKSRSRSEFILQHNKDLLCYLQKYEKSLKIGFACLLLRYFSSTNVLLKEKERLSKDDEEICWQNKPRQITEEKLKMMEEEKNTRYRKRLTEEANEKARIGAEKKRLREHLQKSEKIRKAHIQQMRITISRAAAITIQRHYRCHLGRKVFDRWRSLRSSIYAYNALCHSSAITISRVFRGHRGRKRAAQLRKDLVEYIISIREAEILDDEEEYRSNLQFGWKRNTVEIND